MQPLQGADHTDVSREFNGLVQQKAPNESQIKVFVEKFGNDALPVLTKQAVDTSNVPRSRIALRALAAVGTPEAVTALSVVIEKQPTTAAVLALADAADPSAVQPLRRLALAAGPARQRIPAVVALRWRGSLQDASKLMQAAEQTRSREVRLHLRTAAAAIQKRTQQLPEGITAVQWNQLQRRFWHTVLQPPQSRSVEVGYRYAAKMLVSQGEVPAVFLNSIDAREPLSAQLVAIQALGFQKEAGQAQQFYTLASSSRILGRAALLALLDIGDQQAVTLTGRLLVQDGFSWPSQAIEGLVNIGTEQAARILETAAGQIIDEDLAAYCRRAAARIKKP
ncbi:MAG: hypothetical protein GY833_18780 [Aestuariibacter sp.]|nr:hypothetical protein [Aestuariibacter sp.]